jgi:hypothetical protein
MLTKILSRAKLKQLFLELFLNKTDKATDVSDNSTTNAVAYGVATIAQKCLKDIAVVESQIMPDSAVGTDLDNAATLFGVPARLGALQSSTYLRIIADSGTFYDKTVVNFSNYNGIRFIPEFDLTVGSVGYGYLKVRSEGSGSQTNVDANSIITINSAPVGHIAVTNEFMSSGGRDVESDEMFRQRVKQHNNIIARYTLEYYNQLFQQFNDSVLRVLNMGSDDDGKYALAIVTQNGIDLLTSELDDLLASSKQYFAITDLNKFGELIGLKLINATWYIVGDPLNDNSGTGIDFRVQLWDGYDPDIVRKNIQINISKYLDFRFWGYGQKVDWSNLLQIVKSTEGVRYVPDNFFFPNHDEVVPVNQLPRVKKFIMRDTSGNIIADTGGVLSPVFYPNN